MVYFNKGKNINPFVVFLFTIFLVSCGGDNKEVERPKKKDNLSQKVGKIADQFWGEMCAKNYKNARAYTTNSSEKSLAKLSKYADDISLSQYDKVDSCWFNQDTTRAFCSCLFLQDNQDKKEIVELVKELYTWKVEYILGKTNNNALVYDYSLTETLNPPEKLNATYAMQQVNLDLFEYYVHVIGADLELGFADVYTLSDSTDSRLKQWELNHYFLDEVPNLKMETHFINSNKFEVTISNFKDENNFEVFQILMLNMVEMYGVPYNAESIKLNDYYKYLSYRWFYKGYNQQIEIRNFKTSIVVEFSTII